MKNKQIKALNSFLKQKDYKTLKEHLCGLNEVDAAEYISKLPKADALKAFRLLEGEQASDVFAYLDKDTGSYLMDSVTDEQLTQIVDELFVDDAVDFISEAPANLVERVLSVTDPQKRKIINSYLQYPEGSAGSIMTSELIRLNEDYTVLEALDKVRKSRIDKETVYTCYVTDAKRILTGVTYLKDLLVSDDDALVGNIMEKVSIKAKTTDDREAVAKLFDRYSVISVPVTDSEGKLVGIVSVDDAIDVLVKETTEDIEAMGGVSYSEKPYMKTKIFTLSKNRIVWLLMLMISATVSGKILEGYETAFAAIPLLVTFIPMMMDTGGNAGSQTSTVIIRSMATGDIRLTDFVKVWFKELGIGTLAGFVLAVANYLRIMILHPSENEVGLVVSLSLWATVVIANSVATFLPMIATKLKQDPAVMSAPFITTIVDAFALVIYFEIAKILLTTV